MTPTPTDEELIEILEAILWRPEFGDISQEMSHGELIEFRVQDFLPLSSTTRNALLEVASHWKRIYVPYTYLQHATMSALSPHVLMDATYFIDLSENPYWNYLNYFQDRWDEGKPFISVEHDIVPWPGAMDSLWECEEDWCYFDYHASDCIQGKIDFPMFGCVKFSANCIEKTPDCWKDLVTSFDHYSKQEYICEPWNHLDTWFADYARRNGIEPHQHWPSVTHINPYRDNFGQPVCARVDKPKRQLSPAEGSVVDYKWWEKDRWWKVVTGDEEAAALSNGG